MTRGAVPPHNMDAQAAVLSASILKPEAFDVASAIVRPEMFFGEEHPLWWEACLEISRRGEPIDVVTIANWMRAYAKNRNSAVSREAMARLGEMIDATPAVANVETHARIVRDLWRLRRCIDEAHALAAEGYTADADVQGYLDLASGRMAALAEDERETSMHSFADVVGEEFGALSAAAKRGSAMSGTPTGFGGLDAMLCGWQPGELYLVAGRPGMGKSIVLMQTAIEIAAQPGNVVALFSCEMSRGLMLRRAMGSLARVDSNAMRGGQLTGEDWQFLTQAAADLSQLPAFINDASSPSPIEIRAKCRRMAKQAEQQGKRLGAVVIDYIQLLNGEALVQRNGTRAQQIGAVSKALVKLAKELRVPVIAGAQLKRYEGKGIPEPPQLSDLRESGDLEQDADGVMFIHREEHYLTGRVPDEKRGVAEFILAKQRNGPTGGFKMKFDGRYTRFLECEAA